MPLYELADPLLSRIEVAAILGMSVPTVQRRIASGDLISIKMGDAKKATIRIRRSEVDRYISACVARTLKKIAA